MPMTKQVFQRRQKDVTENKLQRAKENKALEMS